MQTSDIEILPVNEFNSKGEEKWREDLDQSIKLHPLSNNRPELRSYVYFKNYGYVVIIENWNAWAKTKKEAKQKGEARLTAHHSILPLM